MNWKRSWPACRTGRAPVLAEGDAAEVHGDVVDVLPVLVHRLVDSFATLVMAASVVSGAISEMEPTKVVFPTAKPRPR